VSRPLLLVGAGGLARETAEAVRAAGRHDLVGFADDDQALWGTALDGLPVLGGTDVLRGHEDWQVVLCPGSGKARAALAARLGLPDVRYATVVHPTAVVPGSCTIGPGSVLLAGVVLTASVVVGRHVVVMPGAVLTHDDVVEDCATLCARVALAGGVHVGAAAYLGAGCLVREHLTVGERAVLGLGAVVLQDVPAGEVWAGVPARQLRGTAAVDVRHETLEETQA
jgi:sugar O-acyltransferase (sialic acid O-acetyltransferase NeuD family)